MPPRSSSALPSRRRGTACEHLVEGLGEHAEGVAFGLVFPQEGACFTARAAGEAAFETMAARGFSEQAARLPVTVLQQLVLADALGIEPARVEGHVDYVTERSEAFARLETPGYALGAFIQPTSVADVRAIADRGETMPQKSTYFYPKLLTGLIFDGLGD